MSVFPTIVAILAATLGAGTLGYVLARRNRWAGLLYIAALLGVAVWHFWDLRDPMALLVLLAPGMSTLINAMMAGYLLAVGATVVGFWRPRPAA